MAHSPLPYALLLLAPLMVANSAPLAGRAEVIDGDTFDLGGTRIRLYGIDAVEHAQSCSTDGKAWACGEAATRRLRSMLGTSAVQCERKDSDAYGRTVATCKVDGIDVAAVMVEDGWATALTQFTPQYRPLETLARTARRGIWNSQFDLPAVYRAANAPPAPRAAAPPAATRRATPAASNIRSANCAIKGNHSRRGDWIYHLPGSKYYRVTRAEAYFCSEAEARAAGYRRARNN
ncbi:MAG: thermonuclease family protein [Sphingomonadales bacterium]|nr:thermonuclease family protein [Sphingomonadales bacterium]